MCDTKCSAELKLQSGFESNFGAATGGMLLSLPGVGPQGDAPPGAGRREGRGYRLKIPMLNLDSSLAPVEPPPPPKRLLATRRLRELLADRVHHGDADVQTDDVPVVAMETQTPPPPEAVDAQVQSVPPQVRESASSPLSAAAALEARRRCNEVHDAEVQAVEEAVEDKGSPGITTVTVVGATGLPPQGGVVGCCSSYVRLQLGKLAARTRIAHGSTQPEWGESMSFFLPHAGGVRGRGEGRGADGLEEMLQLEVVLWHPSGETVIGTAAVPVPEAGAAVELEPPLGGQSGSRSRIRLKLRATSTVGLPDGGQAGAGGRGHGGGPVQAPSEVDVDREGEKFEAAVRRVSAAALQARCRALLVSTGVLGGAVSVCDQSAQTHGLDHGDVEGSEAVPHRVTGGGVFEGTVVMDEATAAEVRNVRLGGGFEGDFERASWHHMEGIIMAEAWEGRRMHYIAPAAGGSAPVRRATEVVLPESEASAAAAVLGAEHKPVLVRSRKQQTAEKLRGLFTELNARLEILHEKADKLDGEMEDARGTDGLITEVMAQSKSRQQISMLDDLQVLEARVQQDDHEIKGLGNLLSQATSDAPAKDTRACRPWNEARDPVKMRKKAAMRRREELVRYRERRENAGRLWSALRGCYVGVEEGEGGGAKGFAF